MSQYELKGYVLVCSEDLLAFLNALPKHIDLTRQEPGCLVFNVTQDNENQYKFHVEECFISKVAFDYHQMRASKTDWAKVSARLEKHYEAGTRY